MRDPVYPAFCAIGAVLILMPLPWHIQARNAGTLIYVGWTFLACLVFMTNSPVWAGNMNDVAPIWCDISSRFVIAYSIALPASSLCIQRRLYRIAAMKDVSIMGSNTRKELAIDLLIGVVSPFVVVALYYIVQPLRYLILEDIGCWPSESNTILSVFMVRLWSVVIGLVSFVFAALTLRAFLTTRRQFSRVLSESGTDLNLSRFFRLMALAGIEMAATVPLSLYFLIYNVLVYPLVPWISWGETHRFIHDISIVSYEEIQRVPGLRTSFDLNRWAVPGCAFLFFMFFGMSSEAVQQYQNIFWRIASVFGFKRPEPKPQPQTTSWTRRMASRMNMSKHTQTTLVPTAHTTITTTVTSVDHHENRSDETIDDTDKARLSGLKIKDLEAQT